MGVKTTSPAGSVSVKPTPVSGMGFTGGFVRVKVKVVGVPGAIEVGENVLTIVGGATTSRLAEAALPAPASLETTAEVVLFLVPAVVPVTFTESAQALRGGTVPPVRVTLPEPAVAVTTPPQVFARPLGVATTRPAGSASVKLTPVRVVTTSELVMVKLRLVVAFSGMEAAPKDLLMVGGRSTDCTAFLAITIPVPESRSKPRA